MATQVQIRRGTSSQVAAFTGAEGEIVVNTTNDSVHVNDGSTAGGFELARADLNNVSDTDLNAALTGNTVSALTVTSLTADGLTVDSPGGSGAKLVYSNNDQSNLRIKLENTGAGGNTWELVGGAVGANNADFTIYDASNTAKRALFSNNGDVSLYEDTGTTPKFFWSSSAESLGIGTGSPASKLHVENGALEVNTDSSAAAVVRINYNATDGIRRIHALETGGGNARPLQIHAQDVRFRDDSTERMRLSGGNLLVGKPSADFTVAGGQIESIGVIGATVNSNQPMFANRLSSDGPLFGFYKDGSTVGSIGADNASINIGTGNTGLLFYNTATAIYPRTAAGAQSNGAINLGGASDRFKDLYLSGNITTSGNSFTATTSGYFFGGAGSFANGIYGVGANNVAINANGTERMRISSAGYVTTPQNPYFRGSYNGSNLAATAIIPQNGNIANRNMTHSGGNTITVPVTGRYLIAQHQLGVATGAQTCIRINGVNLAGSFTQHTGGANGSFTTLLPIELNASDYVQFVVIAGSIHGNPSYNVMSVTFIG